MENTQKRPFQHDFIIIREKSYKVFKMYQTIYKVLQSVLIL